MNFRGLSILDRTIRSDTLFSSTALELANVSISSLRARYMASHRLLSMASMLIRAARYQIVFERVHSAVSSPASSVSPPPAATHCLELLETGGRAKDTAHFAGIIQKGTCSWKRRDGFPQRIGWLISAVLTAVVTKQPSVFIDVIQNKSIVYQKVGDKAPWEYTCGTRR